MSHKLTACIKALASSWSLSNCLSSISLSQYVGTPSSSGVVCLCVCESEWCDSGPAAEAATRSVSLVCLLSVLLRCLQLLFDCYQTSVLFERVCAHVIRQCLSPESDIQQRISAWHIHNTYRIKTYTMSHRTSSPVLSFFALRTKCACFYI